MKYILFLFLSIFLGCIQPTIAETQSSCQVFVFTASWCSACQRDKPQIGELKKHADVIMVDSDTHPDQIRKYQIKRLPTYILFVNGVEQLRTNKINEVQRSL